MKTEDKILTKHPQGKNGRNISRATYELIKKEMIAAVTKKPLTATEIFSVLKKKLGKKIDGNVGWYGETVKLDLEARKVIQRTSTKPQKYILRK